jgi:two-component system chemotaxis response regulator CheB
MDHEVVVVGASAGGIDALQQVFSGLPSALRASVCVVIHTSPTSPGFTPVILERAGQLPVRLARDGDKLEASRAFVAPPDHHLLIDGDALRLQRGPRENGFRPAVDPLFRSAAVYHGVRAIGVVLSGLLDDGSQGLREIKRQGGIAVVQEPSDAFASAMPLAALRSTSVDHVLPAAAIGPLIAQLVARRTPPRGCAVGPVPALAEPGQAAIPLSEAILTLGPPTGLTCPECGGALWEGEEGESGSYRCHVGHRFQGQALAQAHDHSVESALWSAVRALEESAELHRRMTSRAARAGLSALAAAYQRRAALARQRAAVIRRVITRGEPEVPAASKGPAQSPPSGRRPPRA